MYEVPELPLVPEEMNIHMMGMILSLNIKVPLL